MKLTTWVSRWSSRRCWLYLIRIALPSRATQAWDDGLMVVRLVLTWKRKKEKRRVKSGTILCTISPSFVLDIGLWLTSNVSDITRLRGVGGRFGNHLLCLSKKYALCMGKTINSPDPAANTQISKSTTSLITWVTLREIRLGSPLPLVPLKLVCLCDFARFWPGHQSWLNSIVRCGLADGFSWRNFPASVIVVLELVRTKRGSPGCSIGSATT